MIDYQYKEQGERLKEVRIELNLTRLQVAKALSITENAYGDFERGRSNLSIAVIKYFAIEHSVSINYIIIGNGPKFVSNTHISGMVIIEELKAIIAKLEAENASLKTVLKNLL